MVYLSERIRTEEDPFKREIYAAGYTSIVEDMLSGDLILYNDIKEKRVSSREIKQLMYTCTLKCGILPDGKKHYWIAEADGSCEKFRNFII